MRYIVVGNGIAGITAAKTLRQHDADSQITVYTNELQNGLYARKDLARQLGRGTLDLNTLYLDSEESLRKQRITTVYDPVIRVFARLDQVLVNHAIRQPYDGLILAVGATPRLLDVPGYSLLGVHQARIYEDFTFINNWIDDLRSLGSVVIGGGVLGMDMSYALAMRGVPVTLIVREPRLGAPWLDAEQADTAAERLKAAGVTIRFNETVIRFESEDLKVLDAVTLSTGEMIPARLAVSCIGVVPNTDFLEDSRLAIDPETRALVVDTTLRTNFPKVFAAGNCAIVSATGNSTDNGHIAHNWALSAEQGRVAALNLLGQRTEYMIPAGLGAVLPVVLDQHTVIAL
jgi:NADPH-dependent 2,4-dienoyl-CoA reductase/sulfur reductase-like enzyme